MTDAERMQFEQVRREAEQARGEVGSLRAHVFGPRGGSGSGNIEFVTLGAHTGTGGDETTAANYAYTFTDSDGVVHTNVSPVDQRPLMTLKPGTRGDWDKANNVLRNVDEVPQTAACSASAPIPFLLVGDVPAFGF